MSITKELYGIVCEKEIYKFVLSNANGVQVAIINLGGIIVSLSVPDRNGNFADVVLGHDTLSEYLESKSFFGAIVGRHANRIEDAKFVIDGVEYLLAKNNGENHIHGGLKGFDKVVWDFEICHEDLKDVLCLKYRSYDGEENYPGNLDVSVKYSLSEDNSLEIKYMAISDKDTVVNLTNHSYFNLSGHASGDVLEHHLMINADRFTPVDRNRIPTGEIKGVKGTPLDFTSPKPIGVGLMSSDENIVCGDGYDHNWIINDTSEPLKKAAELYDPSSGRSMEVYTTKPGVQFYSGNFLNNASTGKGNYKYDKWYGICLETQYFPNSLKYNHFPSPVLKKDMKYLHTTIFKFGFR